MRTVGLPKEAHIVAALETHSDIGCHFIHAAARLRGRNRLRRGCDGLWRFNARGCWRDRRWRHESRLRDLHVILRHHHGGEIRLRLFGSRRGGYAQNEERMRANRAAAEDGEHLRAQARIEA